MTFQIETSCPGCEEMITVDVRHEPEQIGSRYCEDIPEYVELEDDSPCECGHVITRDEEDYILSVLKRSF